MQPINMADSLQDPPLTAAEGSSGGPEPEEVTSALFMGGVVHYLKCVSYTAWRASELGEYQQVVELAGLG